MRTGYATAGRGQVVGLLGGSFDPPHAGHVHVSEWALRAFGIDRVWWLVSPGNPLKARAPAPYERRLAACRALVGHPRITVSDIEARMGTRYTCDTIASLRARYPGQRFVWLMGADSLAGFHRWENWQSIIESVPVGVLARPGQRISARLSVTAQVYARYRLARHEARLLGRIGPPHWAMINVPMRDISSTEIRNRGGWRP